MSHIGMSTAAVACTVLFIAGVMPSAEAGGPDLDRGKSVYMEVCKTCHGVDGRGAGTMKLNPPAADLTSPRVQGKLDAGLFKSVHDGRKNTAMGAWKYALSDDEIRDVIAYVRTFDGGALGIPKP